MATIINASESKFIDEQSFTDETQRLTINGWTGLKAPGSSSILRNIAFGMSLYAPENFSENTMFIPFESKNPYGPNGTSYYYTLDWDMTIYTRELRVAAMDSNPVDVYVYFKGEEGGDTYIFWDKCSLSVVSDDYFPVYTVAPSYTINDSLTKTLTGNSNTVIRYVTDATITFSASAAESAIYGYTVRNGEQTVYKAVLSNPTSIDASAAFIDVESALFTTVVEDSYGYSASSSVQVPNFIEYFYPTCRIKAQAPSATGGSTAVTVDGIAFNQSFGTQFNTINVQCRYRNVSSNTWSNWVTMSVTRNGSEYTATVSVTGLDYQSSYIFEGRVIDVITTVTSTPVYAKTEPIFDWAEEDFNFNVPVNINGTFSINDQTILRHTGTSTNNTVLSASGGHIYIRPGGTSTTDGEVKITPQGNVELKGNLTLTTGDITCNGVTFSKIVEVLQNIGLLD